MARSACSRVWPPRSKPVSNSPLRAEITRMPTSACGGGGGAGGRGQPQGGGRREVPSSAPGGGALAGDAANLAGAGDHVGHIVLVARRVEDGVALRLGLKVRTAYLDGLALGPLLLVGVLWRAPERAGGRTMPRGARAKRRDGRTIMKARNHESRFFSLASFSYFSMVRASTCAGRGEGRHWTPGSSGGRRSGEAVSTPGQSDRGSDRRRWTCPRRRGR